MDPETDAEACALLQDLMIDWNSAEVVTYAAANAETAIPELECVLVRWRAQNLLADSAMRSTASVIYAGAYATVRLTVGSSSKAPEHHSTTPFLVHRASAELGDDGRAKVRQMVDRNWDALRDDTEG